VCIVALSARNPLSLRSIRPMKKRSFVPEPTSDVYHTSKRSCYNEWSRLPCVKPLACWCPKCCHTANENAAPSESICSARVYTVPGIPLTCLCGRPARRRWQDWLSKTRYIDSGTHLSSIDGAGCAAQVSIAARAATLSMCRRRSCSKMCKKGRETSGIAYLAYCGLEFFTQTLNHHWRRLR